MKLFPIHHHYTVTMVLSANNAKDSPTDYLL